MLSFCLCRKDVIFAQTRFLFFFFFHVYLKLRFDDRGSVVVQKKIQKRVWHFDCVCVCVCVAVCVQLSYVFAL